MRIVAVHILFLCFDGQRLGIGKVCDPRIDSVYGIEIEKHLLVGYFVELPSSQAKLPPEK